jgi:alkanesulfonate monooxygenase SsuD/methylene tetrahydromethanopterin reductase-like flavin-dependent oxidoreductase (luciferase family)
VGEANALSRQGVVADVGDRRAGDDHREFGTDIGARREALGRKPDDCKVLFLVSPVVADANQEAHEKLRRWMVRPGCAEYVLAGMSSITEVNFARSISTAVGGAGAPGR